VRLPPGFNAMDVDQRVIRCDLRGEGACLVEHLGGGGGGGCGDPGDAVGEGERALAMVDGAGVPVGVEGDDVAARLAPDAGLAVPADGALAG
jgi:hypothetical protein